MTATGETPSHLAHDLLRIHKVITRGIGTIRTRGAEFARDGFPEAGVRRGFLDYARCLLTTLRNHHDAEETVVFPRLAKIATAPFARLEEEHQTLLQHLDAADAAIVALGPTATGADAASLGRLVAAMAQVDALWKTHIAVEEGCFTVEALDRATTPAEQADLGRAIGEHAARTSKPEPLILPFILHSLEGADRAAMAHRLPPVVTQQLIPGPWKAEWVPMVPFLLA